MSKELLGTELYYRDLCESYYGLSDKASTMKKLSLKLNTFRELFNKLKEDEKMILQLQDDINILGQDVLMPCFRYKLKDLVRFTTRLYYTHTDKPIEKNFLAECYLIKEYLDRKIRALNMRQSVMEF
ncbi:hypothetical protein ACNSOP_09120 [Aliarcobacter lanthieri]|uniref:hypothetical protein n=1 Tax=Aliarcobacter lanthieri TaxID=1355374 RepID=UPI003AAE846F